MKWRTVGECSIGSQREQLCPRQSYDVSFILSVWCLSSSLLRSLSLYVSVCLPHSGLIQSPVEAMMKPSSLHHTQLPSCSGITHFNDTFTHGAIQIDSCAVYAPLERQHTHTYTHKHRYIKIFFVDNWHGNAVLVLTYFTKLFRRHQGHNNAMSFSSVKLVQWYVY